MGGFWSAVGTIVTDGGTLIAAIAASMAAYFTYRIMLAGQKQVELSQAQNKQAIESERDAQLPVLMPTAPIMMGNGIEDVEQSRSNEGTRRLLSGYDRNLNYARVELQNMGPGIALNVWGVIFEPEPESQTAKVTGKHHFHRYELPLSSGAEVVKAWKGVGLPFGGDADLGATALYKLYAPPIPALGNLFMGATEINARLTVTYSDIFGRKHAAIYDLTAQFEWVNVAYLRNIPRDLDDLTRMAPGRVSVLMSPGLPTLSPE